jgi:periplasmic divalent cation tolerance protein
VTSTAESSVSIVLTTIAADSDAAALAQALLDERLAACVSVLPAMLSMYRWNGIVEQEREQQVVIKTTPECLAALEVRLNELHPYELPEFIVIGGEAAKAYAEWVRASVRPASAS